MQQVAVTPSPPFSLSLSLSLNNYVTTYDNACLKEVRLGELVTEGGREFHGVITCGAKEHIKYIVFLSCMAIVGGDCSLLYEQKSSCTQKFQEESTCPHLEFYIPWRA